MSDWHSIEFDPVAKAPKARTIRLGYTWRFWQWPKVLWNRVTNRQALRIYKRLKETK